MLGVSSCRYAPQSCSRCTRMACTRPSASAAIVAVCSWSRPWMVETIDSERVSIHLTGRPVRREACAIANSSA